jgi:dihydrofolate reductase
MGLITFALNLTLDGCIDHRAGIPDDELHDYFTALMDAAGAMLWGRTTYELMEGAFPALARDENAPRAIREWARKLEEKQKYVVSSTRRDFSWNNTFRVEGDLGEAMARLKAETPGGIIVGSPMLAAGLERLGLIDEYRLVLHPVIAGRGPTLFSGLAASRRLDLVSTHRLKSGVLALHYRAPGAA